MTSNLSKGFTDNMVTRVDDLVIKTGKCAANELAWYNAYLDKADIPYIMGEKDGSLVMKYVERSGEFDILELIKLVKKYENYKKINELTFESYIQKIATHLLSNEFITNGEKLMQELYKWNFLGTFSHGDLSIQNIIPTSTGLKLIDPLYSKDTFGASIIDYAKLLFSLKFYNNDIARFNQFMELIFVPDCLIASECVRVATYKKQFSFIAENLINEL